MPDTRLAGKVAVVTGGGRGIGRAIALAFADERADLCLVSRTSEQLDAVAAEVQAKGRRAVTIPTDVTEKEQVRQMADRVKEAFGRIDLLVNNAGGGIEKSKVLESDPDLWVKDVTVNLLSAYLVTQALLPLMVDSGGGKIINTGSGMGHSAGAGGSAYHTGKAGMWMFTRCLAAEVWEHGIDVNELIPGPVATHLTAGRMKVGGPPPFAPSERVKAPDDVAPLALFLATQPQGGPTAQSFSLTRRPI